MYRFIDRNIEIFALVPEIIESEADIEKFKPGADIWDAEDVLRRYQNTAKENEELQDEIKRLIGERDALAWQLARYKYIVEGR